MAYDYYVRYNLRTVNYSTHGLYNGQWWGDYTVLNDDRLIRSNINPLILEH